MGSRDLINGMINLYNEKGTQFKEICTVNIFILNSIIIVVIGWLQKCSTHDLVEKPDHPYEKAYKLTIIIKLWNMSPHGEYISCGQENELWTYIHRNSYFYLIIIKVESQIISQMLVSGYVTKQWYVCLAILLNTINNSYIAQHCSTGLRTNFALGINWKVSLPGWCIVINEMQAIVFVG